MVNAISSQHQEALNILTQHRKTPPGSPVSQKQTPPPGFAEIAQSSRDNKSPQTTVNIAQKQMPPSGFMAVAKSLGEGKPPWMSVKILQEMAAPGFIVGSAMTTMMTTQIHQDEMTGVTYMDTVTVSMGLINLGTPLMVGDHPTPTIEDVTNTD